MGSRLYLRLFHYLFYLTKFHFRPLAPEVHASAIFHYVQELDR